MKAIFLLDQRYRHDPWYTFYLALGNLCLQNGYVVETIDIHTPRVGSLVLSKSPDMVVIWNGLAPGYKVECDMIKGSGVRTVFHEIAWFPQKDTIYLDNNGLQGHALREPIPMDYDPEQWEKTKEQYITSVMGLRSTSREALDNKLSNTPGPSQLPKKFILVVGQLESDTSMLFNPIQKMQQLVDIVAAANLGVPIVYREHPVASLRKQVVNMPTGVLSVSNSPLYPTLKAADAVIGLNSTVLLESLLVGTQSFSFGGGVWSHHAGVIPRVTAATLRDAVLNCRVNPVMQQALLRHLFNIQIKMMEPRFNARNLKVLFG